MESRWSLIAEAMRLDGSSSIPALPPICVAKSRTSLAYQLYITSGASIHIGNYTYIYIYVCIILYMSCIYRYIILGYIISISLLWGYLTTFLVRMSCFTAWQGQEVVLVRIAVAKLGLLWESCAIWHTKGGSTQKNGWFEATKMGLTMIKPEM